MVVYNELVAVTAGAGLLGFAWFLARLVRNEPVNSEGWAGFFGVTGDLSNNGYALITVEGEPAVPIMIAISIGFLIMTVPLGILLDRIEKRRAVAR